MVTFAQAQERAEEWVNADVPAYQHREVRVREFESGFVVWAEDREGGPVSDGGRQRLVIARDGGEASLWPGLPVGEVIRRYEEEYGAPSDAVPAPEPPQRIDLNQTSFLLSPPEWLQDAADKLGIPGRPASGGGADASRGVAAAGAGGSSGGYGSGSPGNGSLGGQGSPGQGSVGNGSLGGAGSLPGSAPHEPTADDGVPVSGQRPVAPAPPAAPVPPAVPAPAAPPVAPAAPAPAADTTPWAGTDTNPAFAAGGDGSVPLPATVFAPPLSGTDDDDTPPPVVGADAPTALMSGGSVLPPTRIVPVAGEGTPGRPGPSGPRDDSALPPTTVAPAAQGPGAPSAPGAGDIADAATSKAYAPPRGGRRGSGQDPQPPGPPGVPGAPGAPRPPGPPGAPGDPAGGYLPTQLVPQQSVPEGARPPGPPGAPGAAAGGLDHAETMLAGPGQAGPPPFPAPPGPPGPAGGQRPPGPPGMPPGPPGGAHHAATMLAGPAGPPPGAPLPPGPPGAPGMPPGPQGPGAVGPGAVPPGPVPHGPGPVPQPSGPPPYGYPQQPSGLPTVGPGYQAVLRYRAPDGSEAQLIRRSAPGTPHPEWQILHELRAMNVPPQQVLELHTELESCELPGAYCARMIRETWPQVRITSVAPYGQDHASRQQGMRHLLTHQGELHQVADGPARPAPVRAPLPPVPPAPPIPPEGVAQELMGAFGPQGICRFDQRAVSRQGVPDLVARTLVWAGLPADFGPFFWAQPAQPVVPTLAELAVQRQIQPAADAGSYLVMGSDFGRAICVQYGTAHIMAVPVEAGPGGRSLPPQFVNTGLPEFTRSLALLGRMWRLRYGLTPEQAGRWTVDFQAQLAALDPAALSSPESWWSVLLEQMWDGLL